MIGGDVGLDPDHHLAAVAGIGQQSGDHDAVDPQPLGHIRLRQTLDIIEPRRPHPKLIVGG